MSNGFLREGKDKSDNTSGAGFLEPFKDINLLSGMERLNEFLTGEPTPGGSDPKGLGFGEGPRNTGILGAIVNQLEGRGGGPGGFLADSLRGASDAATAFATGEGPGRRRALAARAKAFEFQASELERGKRVKRVAPQAARKYKEQVAPIAKALIKEKQQADPTYIPSQADIFEAADFAGQLQGLGPNESLFTPDELASLTETQVGQSTILQSGILPLEEAIKSTVKIRDDARAQRLKEFEEKEKARELQRILAPPARQQPTSGIPLNAPSIQETDITKGSPPLRGLGTLGVRGSNALEQSPPQSSQQLNLGGQARPLSLPQTAAPSGTGALLNRGLPQLTPSELQEVSKLSSQESIENFYRLRKNFDITTGKPVFERDISVDDTNARVSEIGRALGLAQDQIPQADESFSSQDERKAFEKNAVDVMQDMAKNEATSTAKQAWMDHQRQMASGAQAFKREMANTKATLSHTSRVDLQRREQSFKAKEREGRLGDHMKLAQEKSRLRVQELGVRFEKVAELHGNREDARKARDLLQHGQAIELENLRALNRVVQRDIDREGALMSDIYLDLLRGGTLTGQQVSDFLASPESLELSPKTAKDLREALGAYSNYMRGQDLDEAINQVLAGRLGAAKLTSDGAKLDALEFLRREYGPGVDMSAINEQVARIEKRRKPLVSVALDQSKPISPGNAGKLALFTLSVSDVERAAKLLINRDGTINKNILGAGFVNLPFSRGRDLRRFIRDAINAKSRMESGAEVRPDEMDKLLDRFEPKLADNDDTAVGRLDDLLKFFNTALEIADPTQEIRRRAAKAKGVDSLGIIQKPTKPKAQRLQELLSSGMSRNDALDKMIGEGY